MPQTDLTARLLLQAHRDPIFIYAHDSLRILEVNRAACARYGWTRAEFLAMTIAELRPEADAPAILGSVALGGEAPPMGVWLHRTKDGQTFPVEIRSESILWYDRAAELVVARALLSQAMQGGTLGVSLTGEGAESALDARMREHWLARWPILGFVLFSHGWTFAFWALAAALAGERGVWAGPAAVAFYIGGAGVFLGGVVMTAALFGRAGLADLARRAVDPRPIGALWWAVILLLTPVLTLVAAGLAQLLGLDGTLAGAGQIAPRLAEPLAFAAFLGFILLIGPLPEEIGWRGYLLDRLLARAAPVAASLVLALLWWSWHLPLPLMPGYFDAFTRDPPSALRNLANLVPTAILYTWLFLNTGRSVLAAILFHWIGNLTGQLLLPSDDVRLIRLILEFALVAALIAHPAAGLRQRR